MTGLKPSVTSLVVLAATGCAQQGVPGPGTNMLNYVGVPNAQYLVQFATNLTTSPRLMLATNTVAANGRGTLMDCTATNGRRSYRISTP